MARCRVPPQCWCGGNSVRLVRKNAILVDLGVEIYDKDIVDPLPRADFLLEARTRAVAAGGVEEIPGDAVDAVL